MKKTIQFQTFLIIVVALLVSCTHEPITPTPPSPDENIDTSKWVDLGLPSGLLWAKCNVGASSPQEFGDYFAWGETKTKSDYDWPTYKYWQDWYLTKYCSNPGWGHNGYTDNLITLEMVDDAAAANMSSGARTPTKAEWEELIANTTHVYTTIDTTYGILFTGSNGNTMFVPSAGYMYRFFGLFSGNEGGTYWTSSVRTDFMYEAWFAIFNADTLKMQYVNRPIGYSVRAVRDSH